MVAWGYTLWWLRLFFFSFSYHFLKKQSTELCVDAHHFVEWKSIGENTIWQSLMFLPWPLKDRQFWTCPYISLPLHSIMRYSCTCTSTNQINNSPPPNVFPSLRYTKLILHSPVLWSGGLITVNPRVLTWIVAAAVLMLVLPCLWPGYPAPLRSTACLSLPLGGRVQAMQHPGTDCSSG